LSLTIMMCSHVILCLQALYVTSSNVTWWLASWCDCLSTSLRVRVSVDVGFRVCNDWGWVLMMHLEYETNSECLWWFSWLQGICRYLAVHSAPLCFEVNSGALLSKVEWGADDGVCGCVLQIHWSVHWCTPQSTAPKWGLEYMGSDFNIPEVHHGVHQVFWIALTHTPFLVCGKFFLECKKKEPTAMLFFGLDLPFCWQVKDTLSIYGLIHSFFCLVYSKIACLWKYGGGSVVLFYSCKFKKYKVK
jgi:hypothetical protein